MTLHVWTIERNEARMLPHFLRHYAPLADRLFVVDDQSDDGTRALAAAHPKVTLLDYPYPTGLHEGDLARAYEALTRESSRGHADWVLCPDADEFLVHADLRRLLAEQQRLGTQAIQADGVLCGADEMPETTGPLWEALPYRQAHAAYSKTIILAGDLPVRFGPGRHTTSLPGVRAVPRPGVTLYHCCYLSPAWVEARLAKNFARIPERPGLAEEEAYRRQRALALRWWRPGEPT
jgi:hypothetical protein